MTAWIVALIVVLAVLPFAVLAYGGYVIGKAETPDDGVRRHR